MQREHEMKFTDCRRELDNAVSDGLIEEYTPEGFKGQSGYRIPEIIDEVIITAIFTAHIRSTVKVLSKFCLHFLGITF